jgi:hypothetical protein
LKITTRPSFRRAAAAIAVFLVALTGVTLSSAAPAQAGSNGQQVYVDGGPGSGYAYIFGSNQDGTMVSSPSMRLNGSGYGQLNDWWWKGHVVITYFGQDGSFAGQRGCDVPQSQWWSNWTRC